MAQNDVFVYTMNQGGTRGKWSRYRWDYVIKYFAHLKDSLYIRTGDRVYEVVEYELYDDGVPFISVIQWPWLDWGRPATTKMMTGFDVAGEGTVAVEVGYDQNDLNAFTVSFELPGDTYTGNIVPIPVAAPSLSLRLTYSSATNWEWNAANLYLQDFEVGK